MYKLIAIDLDGTLLNSQKRISKKNKDAVKLAYEKGINIIICSGRIFAGARMYAGEMGINGPLIACNGAIIKNVKTMELMYSSSMRNDDYKRVIDICHKEDIYFHTYIEDTMYTEKLEFSSKFYYERNKEVPESLRFDIQIVKNALDIVKADGPRASKIVAISSEPELLLKIRKQVEDIKTVAVMSSDKDNFEVVNFDVSKGNALRFLCDRLGVKREETIAIGDNENDYSMIKFAGLGVAMGNAENSIKEIGDYITLNNDEDGVADVIEKFIL